MFDLKGNFVMLEKSGWEFFIYVEFWILGGILLFSGMFSFYCGGSNVYSLGFGEGRVGKILII